MSKNNNKIYQVNLEELISNFVWGKYKESLKFYQKIFLRRSDYDFDIRWGYVDFAHVTIDEKVSDTAPKKVEEAESDDNKPNAETEEKELTDEAKLLDDANKTLDTNQSTDALSDAQIKEAPQPSEGGSQSGSPKRSEIQKAIDRLQPDIEEGKKKDVELYVSEYENKTSTEQTYKFTTTRQTTESIRFEIQENYTIGATTNLSVNLGDIVTIGAEITGSYSITKTKAEEFTKSLTWNIDTEIKVPMWNRARATLYVYEMMKTSSFLVKTTVSLPTGNLPVSIIRKKDGKEMFVYWLMNLGVLFDTSYKNRSSVKVIQKEVERKGRLKKVNFVELTTRGICKVVGFKNQHVEVTCQTMEDAPADILKKLTEQDKEK